MTEPYPYYAVYELQGSAAEAARNLIDLERQIVEQHPAVIRGKNHVMPPRDYNLMRREVNDALARRAPAFIRQLGLDAPAVQVEQHYGGLPRAYNHFPHIMASSEPERFFVFCPLDYKGGHHIPAEAKRVPDDQLHPTDFGEMVHKEIGYLSPPLLTRNKAGTFMPGDFDPAVHRYREDGIEGHRYKVFIAAGTSLSCVQDFLKRKDELEAAKKLIVAEIEKLAPALDPKKHLLGVRPGDQLKAGCRFKTDKHGKPELWLTLEKTGELGTRSVGMRDNPHFILEDFDQGSYRIAPNRETPEGRKLGRLFDGLTSEPDLGQYWQLWNPTASGLKGQFHSRSAQGDKVPKLDTVRGVHYLVYLIDEKAPKDHCNPPGGIPVSLAEYLWLKADLKDEAEFVRLPEPPQQLSHMRPIKAPAPAP